MSKQWWIVAAVAAVVLWFFVSIEPVLAPFFVSMVLAYLGDPIADRLEERGLSRQWAVCVVFVLLTLLVGLTLLLLVPLLGQQIGQLVEALPAVLSWIQSTVLPELQSLTGLDLSTDFDALRKAVLENWKETGTVAASAMPISPPREVPRIGADFRPR